MPDFSALPQGNFVCPDAAMLEKARAFTARGIAGAEIYTLLCCGALPPERSLLCETDGDGLSAVLLWDGDRQILCRKGEAPCRDALLLRLDRPARAPGGCRALTKEDLLRFYLLISGGKTLCRADEARYVARVKAMNRGLSEGVGVFEDGRLCAAAWITAQNETAALLGDVYTAPFARGKGYGSKNVLALCRKAQAAGKTPYVLCEERRLSFYRRLGFEIETYEEL